MACVVMLMVCIYLLHLRLRVVEGTVVQDITEPEKEKEEEKSEEEDEEEEEIEEEKEEEKGKEEELDSTKWFYNLGRILEMNILVS